jgi:hypothetical protein
VRESEGHRGGGSVREVRERAKGTVGKIKKKLKTGDR